jgi:hypothetical protein
MRICLLACDKIFGPSPNQVLNNFLDATFKQKYAEAYSYVSAEDQANKDLQCYLKEKDRSDYPLAQAIVTKTSYKIIKLEKSDKTATAEVELTFPDANSVFADSMSEAFKSALDTKDIKETNKILAKKLESGEIPLRTGIKTYRLVKDEEGWKVFLDWKTEKKINALLAEADALKEAKKLNGAAEKYEQILKLDSEMVNAKIGLKETEKEIKSFEEKQTYIENVILYDLKAKYYETFLDGKIPGVEFKLKNKGDRTLKGVDIAVYFKDDNGTIIAEEDYHPVLVSEYSFGNDNKPLKPNYVWQMERGKFYQAKSVPSEWKEGAVSAKITDIEFDE